MQRETFPCINCGDTTTHPDTYCDGCLDRDSGLTHEDCLDGPDGCAGQVEYQTLDGLKFWPRCARHFGIRLDREDRYREFDSPSAPDWFDAGYAGERWEEDY